MFKDTLFEELRPQIQAQFRETNIEKLLNGILDIKKKYFYNAYKSLILDNLSLTSAKSIGLDLWGNLLHFNRFIPSNPDDDYQYFNFNNKNFYKLIFYNPNKPTYSQLGDENFKQILILLYQGQFIYPAIPNINVFVQEIFNKYGKVVVKDTFDMSFQVFVFNEKIPDWLKWIFSNYDVMPRPAGVWFKVIERIIRRFGFGPDKPYKDKGYRFFNFNKTNFKNLIFYDKMLSYPNNIIPEDFGKDITQEDYERRLEWAKKNISAFYHSNFWDGDKNDNKKQKKE